MDSSLPGGQRYRVFLNEKSVLISEDINIADNQVNNRIVIYENVYIMRTEYEQFSIDADCSTLIIIAKNRFREVCNAFRSIFSEIKAAGGLVTNQAGNLLFILRLGVWDLPKGKLKSNESPEEGALREVEEETGLADLIIGKQLPSTFHIYTGRKGKVHLKETYWFEMSYFGNETPIPQTEEDITEVHWFNHDQMNVVLKNTYASLRDMIGGYL